MTGWKAYQIGLIFLLAALITIVDQLFDLF